MSRITRICVLAAMALLLAGCITLPPPPPPGPTAFEIAAPRSILVVPAVNRSLDVSAPNQLLPSLTVPLAEKGYYVFPVNTVKVVLEQEGFYEPEQVQRQPPADLAKLFGADAVLYVTINRWDAKYIVLSTTVTVALDYRMVARDGTEIWSSSQKIQYTPGENGSDFLSKAISGAISAVMTRASPEYLPLVRKAHEQALMTGPDAIPDGPYLLSPKGVPLSREEARMRDIKKRMEKNGGH